MDEDKRSGQRDDERGIEDQDKQEEDPKKSDQEKADEQAEESFPASDPPAW